MSWRDSFETSSGYSIEPVYTSDSLSKRGFAEAKDLGTPGQFPYTRGFDPQGYREKLWEIEMYAGFGSATDARSRYQQLLAEGATGGVSMALDLPTQIGLDSDDPLAAHEVGRVGVAIDSLADVETIFEEIPLSEVGHVFTTGNAIGPIVAAMFFVLAERREISVDEFRVQIQNDPIKEYVARGTQIVPIEAAVKLACDVVEYCAQAAPTWLPISVSGSHMKQAGASPTQEAAFTLANAIAYVDELVSRGLDATEMVRRFELHFCTDMDFYEEIAKYRAVRRIWSEILRDRFHISDTDAYHFRLHAATSGLPLTAQQPLNNIARITLQALAQIMGGVEGTRTASFDEALAIPTQEAATTSIRINQIIAYETGIPYTVDPWAGSYFMESLTLDMLKQIRRYLNEIEELGGAIQAVRSGYYEKHLWQGAYRQERELAEGRRIVVGVNRFESDERVRYRAFQMDPDAADRQRRHLQEMRERRDQAAVRQALAGVRDAVQNNVNVMPAVIEAVRRYATVGEICDCFREHYGVYSAAIRAV